MKALSVKPEFAAWIFAGVKTVECRSWPTKYRGDLVICSTADRVPGAISGHALCVVRLADCVPFTRDHLAPAGADADFNFDGLFAWVLDDLRIIRPVPVKGRLSLWTYDGPLEYLPDPASPEEDEAQYKAIWEPLIYKG